jgi:hypothetical protein
MCWWNGNKSYGYVCELLGWKGIYNFIVAFTKCGNVHTSTPIKLVAKFISVKLMNYIFF